MLLKNCNIEDDNNEAELENNRIGCNLYENVGSGLLENIGFYEYNFEIGNLERINT